MTNLFPWKKVLNKFELVRSEVIKRVCVARQNIWIIQFLLLVFLSCFFQAQLNNSLCYTVVLGFAHLRTFPVRHTCKITTATTTRNTRSNLGICLSSQRISCKNIIWSGVNRSVHRKTLGSRGSLDSGGFGQQS